MLEIKVVGVLCGFRGSGFGLLNDDRIKNYNFEFMESLEKAGQTNEGKSMTSL
jgi:hypothetical protein